MAKADFSFTYYDGDATRDMAHMNRLERGAYTDVIIQQRQRGHLSLDDLKKFLSKDFDAVWGALEWVLKKDAEGKFFIEWLETSEKRAKTFSRLQKDRRSGKTKSEPNPNPVKPKTKRGSPVGDGDGNGDEDEDLGEYEKWTLQISDNADPTWEPMFMNSGIRIPPGKYLGLVQSHLQLLARYPNMRPQTQQAFRHSLLKHINENKDKEVANGTVSKNGTDGINAARADFAKRASDKPSG